MNFECPKVKLLFKQNLNKKLFSSGLTVQNYYIIQQDAELYSDCNFLDK